MVLLPPIKRTCPVLLSLAAGLCLVHPAHAARQNPQTVASLSADNLAEIESLEKRGLYFKTADGSLGPDFWKGAKRSAITLPLQDLPPVSPEKPVQKLIHGILLTQNEGGIINDKPPEPGRDIFTLRMKKLLSAGLYSKAALLYGTLDEDPYNEQLAYNGSLALLLNGDKSAGCIEAQAAGQRFDTTDLFKNLVEYCNISVKAASQKTAPLLYNPDIFKAYSVEKLAMLSADDAIDASSLTRDIITKIPYMHIPLLLQTTTLSDENRFLLNVQAAHWGLITTADLQDDYETISSQAAAAKTASPEEWKKIPIAYANAVKADPANRWSIIRGILPLQKTYGLDALIPFADMIHDMDDKDINYSEIQVIIPLMIRNNDKIPLQLVEIADELIRTQPEETQDSGLLAVIYLSKPIDFRKDRDKKSILNILNHRKNKENLFVNYIIENIDKADLKVNNDFGVYEKDYRLTFAQDYVMPSLYVWHQLQDISQESNIGETVLLSTLALGDKTLSDINPDVLLTILRDLEKVGLTEISERLALSALIGNSFKGEN